MNLFEIVGWFATFFSIFMFLPQTMMVIKTKSTFSISKLTYILLSFGLSMWTIFAPLVGSYQGWAANAIILVLTFPIMWFLFKDKKWLIVIFTSWMIFAISISIVFLLLKLFIPLYAKYIFLILAGSSTGFAFIPQSIKTVRTNDISDNSLAATLLVIFSNLLWVIYWVGMITNSVAPDTTLNILSLSFTASLLIFQLPILYVFMKKKKA